MRSLPHRNRGFTLVELTVVLVLSSLLFGAVTAISRSGGDLVEAQSGNLDMQGTAARAMRVILSDLRQTGRVDLGGGAVYPYLYADGAAAGVFAGYSHAPSVLHTPAASQAHGPSQEILFKTLKDLDGDGKFTNAATGAIEWSNEDYGYAIVTGADGVNRLMRQVNGAGGTVVATDVERVLFEEQDDDPALGANQIRATLFLAIPDPDPQHPGNFLTERFIFVVNMRNVAGQGDIE